MQESMRTAFEAWASRQWTPEDFARGPKGHYTYPVVWEQFEAWQAAWSARTPSVEGLVEALEAAMPFLENGDSPGGCDGSYPDCAHCAAITKARAALASYRKTATQ